MRRKSKFLLVIYSSIKISGFLLRYCLNGILQFSLSDRYFILPLIPNHLQTSANPDVNESVNLSIVNLSKPLEAILDFAKKQDCFVTASQIRDERVNRVPFQILENWWGGFVAQPILVLYLVLY